MTDKEKFRKEVEKLKSNLIYGACSSQIAMETRCKEEAYNEVLAILDTMQEEPVSEFLNTESMIESYKQRLISQANGVKNSPLISMCLASYKHGINEILDTLNLSNVQRTVKDWKEPVSEELGDYINELSKQFPEVSFAKLSRIAVRVSRWQRNQDTKNKLPKVINRTDLDEFAYQCAYDLSNDWAIDNPTWHDVEDACKLGAKWQKEQDQSTIELAEDHAMLAGMDMMKEEMMKNIWKSADGEDLPEIDREVIALFDNGKVGFAHRPPEFWDGKNIITGEVTRNYPKTYGKGGWNIPNVKYWLDCNMDSILKRNDENNKIDKR